MIITIVDKLSDLTNLPISDFENHWWFKTLWNEAGIIGRIEFYKVHPTPNLRIELEDEIANIRERYSKLSNPSTELWNPIIKIIDEFSESANARNSEAA